MNQKEFKNVIIGQVRDPLAEFNIFMQNMRLINGKKFMGSRYFVCSEFNVDFIVQRNEISKNFQVLFIEDKDSVAVNRSVCMDISNRTQYAENAYAIEDMFVYGGIVCFILGHHYMVMDDYFFELIEDDACEDWSVSFDLSTGKFINPESAKQLYHACKDYRQSGALYYEDDCDAEMLLEIMKLNINPDINILKRTEINYCFEYSGKTGYGSWMMNTIKELLRVTEGVTLD